MRKANEVAREMWAPSTWEQRMSPAGQFTTFCRTHERSISEESCAAFLMGIFDVAPPAQPQHARMLRSMSQMDRTPLGMAILGLQKIAARKETKQVRPSTKERGGRMYPQPGRLEGTCCFLTHVGNGEPLFRDRVPDTQQFHNGAGRDHKFGSGRGAKDGESGSPPRLAVREGTRAGRARHYKVMQDTSRKRKAHESYDRTGGASSGSLACHGAFHKTRCAAARCSNRGHIQFGSTRDLAVGEARRPVRPSREHSLLFVEVHHNADPGIVAGRIDVKGEAAAGQEPWLRAEERFFHDLRHNHAATITRRAPRTRPATPQDERAIPLQQVNVPVLNLEWIKSRLHPATLESLMQVWDSSGGPLSLNPPPVKRAKSSGGFRSLTRYG
ncbi:hypothetical protein TcCL_NonESM12506 [Trypanosoma cruzi]|nr:hypothetical protein TcCL_NonESM12506 [Trypanosoma cruzi]